MRHQNKKHSIGTTSAHRKSLLKNLAAEIIDHGKIKTTHTKCKAVQGYVEKLITIGKIDSIHHRRLAYMKLNNPEAVKKLFEEVGPRFKTRNGGYTRVVKVADGRVGDNAKMSFIALVD
ncbi:MAG: 50S ribosomal protein L17 [Bdellovibrionales bacterium RIFOXYA1_FULL_36_14]|nr:MAG: 50S ribosomal protein L17 [Bdellovibrionales bacterium RIFOXYA1_FULL_36_14]